MPLVSPLVAPLVLGLSDRAVRPIARSSDSAAQRPESVFVRAAVSETQPALGEGAGEGVGEASPGDVKSEKARRGAAVAVAAAVVGRLARASDAAAHPAEPVVVIAAVGETHPAWGEGALVDLAAVEAEAEVEVGAGVAEAEVENERAGVGRFARSSDADRHPAEPVATDAVCESKKRKWSRSRPCLSLPRAGRVDVSVSATTPGGPRPRFIARSSDAKAQALVVAAAVPVGVAMVDAARRVGGARSLVDATTESRGWVCVSARS